MGEKEHHQTTSRINPQRRNVDQSQEALGQDSAQRHRRCSRQRIYDPFAQESMSIRRLQGIAWESNEGEALTRIQLHGVTFKKRAPRAIKEIKAFATKSMGTTDVRLDPQLNKKVWEAGIKGVPYRLRVRISRKRNDEEGATERLYSYVQAVNVKDAKGLQTALVEDA